MEVTRGERFDQSMRHRSIRQRGNDLRSCLSLLASHDSRHGRLDAAAAQSAMRRGGHGHDSPHQTHRRSSSGRLCRSMMCCASRRRSGSMISVVLVKSLLTAFVRYR